MIFIDSGPFIARYISRDQFHKKALLLWEKVRQSTGKCFTSNFVLDEVFTFVGRKAGNSFSAQRAEKIYASNMITILRPDINDEVKAIEYFSKYSDQKISFTDCISFVLMKKHRIKKVLTFDTHFQFAGFSIFD